MALKLPHLRSLSESSVQYGETGVKRLKGVICKKGDV